MFSKVTKDRRGDASHDAVLTASEIGEYEFCRVAWYLRRCGVPPGPDSISTLEHGAREHRRIADHARRARTLQGAEKFLLIVIVVLLAVVLSQFLRNVGLVGL
jgi:hypothetical protein